MKLHNNYFKELENYDDFMKIFKLVIGFRNDKIKQGWAIKYGLEFQEKKYPELESLNEEQLLAWKDPRGHVRWSLDDIKEEWLK